MFEKEIIQKNVSQMLNVGEVALIGSAIFEL